MSLWCVIVGRGFCAQIAKNDKCKDFEALKPHQHPIKITLIPERPYFHFKTNRKELTEEIMRG